MFKRNTWFWSRYFLVSTLLVLALVLSACGGDEEPTAVAEPTSTPIAAMPADEEVTPEVTEEEAIDVEGETTVVSEEVITDTGVITSTEVLTETIVTTQTEVTGVITETQVITTVDTDTDVTEETETTTESDTVTETDSTEGEAAVTVPDTDESGEAARVGVVDARNQFIYATTLLGHDFQNLNEEVSGEVEDLLLDTQEGRVLFATLVYGGFLGIGDKTIVAPLNALRWGGEDDLILNAQEQTLENLPDVDDDWPNLADPTWDDQFAQYWTDLGIDHGVNVQNTTDRVAWASDLIGYSFPDWDGRDAEVTDILIELSSGEARYALIDMAGAGPYVVPLTALDVATIDGEVYGNPAIDAALVESSPQFDQSLVTERGLIDVTVFDDGIAPYWEGHGF